jgi:hypothetical protein
MVETERRRAVLSAILNDPKSSPETLLRACELSERLDSRPDADPDYLAWKQFAAMSDEALDAELEGLMRPVLSSPALLDDPIVRDRINREAGRIAREMNASLFKTNAELRAALTEAQALRGVPDLAKRRQAASEAPSASQTAPAILKSLQNPGGHDDRPLKVVEIPEALRRTAATATKPKQDRVRTSFERKIRGE